MIAEGTSHASAGRRRAQAKAGGVHVFLLTSFMQVAAMETPESVDTDSLSGSLQCDRRPVLTFRAGDISCSTRITVLSVMRRVLFYHLRDMRRQGCISSHLISSHLISSHLSL